MVNLQSYLIAESDEKSDSEDEQFPSEYLGVTESTEMTPGVTPAVSEPVSPDSDQLSYNLHFWLGNDTSQDEAGAAAYKTVELDDRMCQAARLYST